MFGTVISMRSVWMLCSVYEQDKSFNETGSQEFLCWRSCRLCSLADEYRLFGRTFYLHLQDGMREYSGDISVEIL
jgi:hypothetical protein